MYYYPLYILCARPTLLPFFIPKIKPVEPIRIVAMFTTNSVLSQYGLAATDLPLLAL